MVEDVPGNHGYVIVRSIDSACVVEKGMTREEAFSLEIVSL
jgi:hypothetical protein